jgi:hypothetical protein
MTTEYHCPRCNGYLTLGRRDVPYVPGKITLLFCFCVALVAAWQFQFEFSPWFGAAVIVVAILVWGESLYRRRNNYWCEHCGTYHSRITIESLNPPNAN